MTYKVAGIKKAYMRYNDPADATAKLSVKIPYANGFSMNTNVNNITFEGDNDADTIFSNAELSGTFNFDKFDPALLTAAFGVVALSGTGTVGSVASVTIGGSGGTGYAVGEEITGTGGGGANFLARVKTIDGDGTVLTTEIIDPGQSYETAPTLAIDTAGGTGATFTAVLAALPNGEDLRIYGGSNAEFNPAPVELVFYAAALDESVVPQKAIDVIIVVPKATISPFKPGDLANRQKQTNQFAWTAKKTTTEITGAPLPGVPAGGATYYTAFLDSSS